MAIKPKDLYKGREKSHRAVKIIAAAAILLVIGVITAFFVIRSYAVYDEDGNATIVWPWDRGGESPSPEDGENPTPESGGSLN